MNSDVRLNVWDKWKLWRMTKDKIMMEKLKSRKLWVAVVTVALTSLSSQLGISPDLSEKVIEVVCFYLGAQGIVDAAAPFARNSK